MIEKARRCMSGCSYIFYLWSPSGYAYMKEQCVVVTFRHKRSFEPLLKRNFHKRQKGFLRMILLLPPMPLPPALSFFNQTFDKHEQQWRYFLNISCLLYTLHIYTLPPLHFYRRTMIQENKREMFVCVLEQQGKRVDWLSLKSIFFFRFQHENVWKFSKSRGLLLGNLIIFCLNFKTLFDYEILKQFFNCPPLESFFFLWRSFAKKFMKQIMMKYKIKIYFYFAIHLRQTHAGVHSCVL